MKTTPSPTCPMAATFPMRSTFCIGGGSRQSRKPELIHFGTTFGGGPPTSALQNSTMSTLNQTMAGTGHFRRTTIDFNGNATANISVMSDKYSAMLAQQSSHLHHWLRNDPLVENVSVMKNYFNPPSQSPLPKQSKAGARLWGRVSPPAL